MNALQSFESSFQNCPSSSLQEYLRLNPALDKAIDEIYLENPNAFLYDDNDFSSRVFHHKPKDSINPKHQIKYAGYWQQSIVDKERR